MIPPFDANGNLPPGLHRANWREFIRRFGNSPMRVELIDGLRLALQSLKLAGCRQVFIDGGFITDQAVPGDFDGCWDLAGVDPYKLDPVLLDFANKRARQKAKFRGELFPASSPADAKGSTFLEFFQIDRNGDPKGIVVINLLRGKL